MAAAAAADAAAAARLPGAVSHIPEDRLPAVREAFRTFDTAGAGDIAVDELAGVLRALRYTVNQTELAEFAERYSADGRIGYEQVLHVVGTVHNRRRGPAAMVAAFREFDPDGSGVITVATFRQILLSLGEHDPVKGGVAPLAADMAEEMVESADPDDTGEVDYAAWVRGLTSQADALRRAGHTPAGARKFMREQAEEKAKGKGGKKKGK